MDYSKRTHFLHPPLLLGASLALGTLGCIRNQVDDTGTLEDLSCPLDPCPYGLYNGLNVQRDFQGDVEEAIAAIEEERLPYMLELGMMTSRIHDDDGYASFAWIPVDVDRNAQDVDLSRTDAIVQLACDNGFSLFPTITPAALSTQTEGQPFLPDEDNWQTYLETVVERYDGDDVFEVTPGVTQEPSEDLKATIQECPIKNWILGNELDQAYVNDTTWCPPETYASFLAQSTEIIHGVDPDATTLYGGLAWRAYFNPANWDLFKLTMVELTDNWSGYTGFDAMAAHVYPNELNLDSVSEFLDNIIELTGSERQLWITEGGFASYFTTQNKMDDHNVSELTQARSLLGLQLMVHARGGGGVQLIDVVDPGAASTIFESYGLREETVKWLSWYSYYQMVYLLQDTDLANASIVLEDKGDSSSNDGMFAYKVPRNNGGELYLLLFDPASLESYTMDGVLSDETITFNLTGLTGTEARILEAVPPEDSGAYIDVGDPLDAFSYSLATITNGSLSVDVSQRPVWVITEPG